MNQFMINEALKMCRDQTKDTCAGCPLATNPENCIVTTLSNYLVTLKDLDDARHSAISATRRAAAAAVRFMREDSRGMVYQSTLDALRKAIEGE